MAGRPAHRLRLGLRQVLAGMCASHALLAGVILALAATGHLAPLATVVWRGKFLERSAVANTI